MSKISRRKFLEQLTQVAGGVILIPTLAEVLEFTGRRYWALDRSMFGQGDIGQTYFFSNDWMDHRYDALRYAAGVLKNPPSKLNEPTDKANDTLGKLGINFDDSFWKTQ